MSKEKRSIRNVNKSFIVGIVFLSVGGFLVNSRSFPFIFFELGRIVRLLTVRCFGTTRDGVDGLRSRRLLGDGAAELDGAEKSVGEEVAEELVAATGEVDAVLLTEAVGGPRLHGIEATHDGELVPDHTAGLAGDAEKSLADERAVVVDVVAALDATVAVVVGDEDKSAVGADGTDRVDEGEVALAEEGRVVVGAGGIVDAYAEDDEVGFGKTEVGGEVGALVEIVGDRSAIDADGMVGDAWKRVLEEEACQGERLPAVTRQDDGKRVDRGGEMVIVAAEREVDAVGREKRVGTVDPETRDDAAPGMAEKDDRGGGEPQVGVGEREANLGGGVGSGDSDAG